MSSSPAAPGRSDRAARIAIICASAIVVIAGIKAGRAVVVPLLLAAFIALVSSPLVLWLRDRRVPAGVAVTAALLLDLFVIVGLGTLLVRSLSGLDARLPEHARALDGVMSSVGQAMSHRGISGAEVTGAVTTAMTSFARGVVESVATVVSNLVLVLLVVMFMLLEATGLRAKLTRLVKTAEDVERLRRVGRDVNRYLAVKVATSAATGLLCGLLCAVVGLEFPVLWGLLAFLLNFVPTVGSIAAAIPPIALALAQLGFGSAVAITSGYVAVNFTIGNFLEPRILGRTLGLSPLVVLLSMILWGWLLGPVGALLSVPLTTIVKIAAEGVPGLEWLAILLGPTTLDAQPTVATPPPEPVAARADANPS